MTFDNQDAINQTDKKIPTLNLNQDIDEKVETEAEMVATYREEGERIMDDAVERAVVNQRLEEQNIVNGELKDLYEMQLYEQRKLQQTVDDVKKQVNQCHILLYSIFSRDLSPINQNTV